MMKKQMNNAGIQKIKDFRISMDYNIHGIRFIYEANIVVRNRKLEGADPALRANKLFHSILRWGAAITLLEQLCIIAHMIKTAI